jgi:hypothetical protein
MTPGPKASMAPPSEYVSPSVAAAPPMATYGQPGYSSQSFNQRGKEILLDHLLDHLLGHLLEEPPCCLLRQSVSRSTNRLDLVWCALATTCTGVCRCIFSHECFRGRPPLTKIAAGVRGNRVE